MKCRNLVIVCLAIAAQSSFSAEPVYGPVIEGFGPVFKIADRDIPLPDGQVFRVVFDAAAYPGGDDVLNVELESVARFINMHGMNGVSIADMDIAVVLHGPALKSVLDAQSYSRRYDVVNPNLELLEHLRDAGVRFYVCGQSMGFRGFDKSELSEGIQVALSAMTMFASLQSEGYSLLP